MTSPTRLLLLADTHLPRRARDLPEAVWTAVDEADLVLHAGDWVDVSLLDALERRSRRLVGCYGNNDGPELRARLPEVARVDVAGLSIAVVHETGPVPRSRGALRRPVPGRRRPGLRAQPHSLGHDDTRQGCGCSTPGRRPTVAASRTAPG